MSELKWEQVDGWTLRLKIYGGWLVTHRNPSGMTFVPDPEHKWVIEEAI